MGEQHVAESNCDTWHSLIGPPMSPLTRAGLLVSLLTRTDV